MDFFLILNAKKIKQMLIIITAAFFTAGILYMERSSTLSVFSTKDGPRAVFSGEKKGKKVALTFDISWGDEKAIPILDVLKKEGIKNATFFLSAAWAERHPDIVKRIKEDGHEIGSMGYAFKNYTDMDDIKIKRDILKAKEVFETLGIKNVTLLRPPTGNFDEKVLKVSNNLGYSVIHWSLDTKDWTNPGSEEIVSIVKENLKGGDIILLHASDSAKQTANALPEIIQSLRQKGFVNTTVSEMIANADARSEEIK